MNHRHYFEKPFRPFKGASATPVVDVMDKWKALEYAHVEHDHPAGDVPHWHSTTVSEPIPYPVGNPGRPE